MTPHWQAPDLSPGMPPAEQVVLPRLLLQWARTDPDRPAFAFRELTWSYDEAARIAVGVATALAELGVASGDVVSVWLPNGPEVVASWLGTNLVGAVFAPLHLAYRGGIIEHTLRVAGAKVLIVHSGLVSRLRDLDTGSLETLIVVGEPEEEGPLRQLRWADVVVRPTGEVSWPADPEESGRHDMALIYTSGTTGPSKGVRCSYLHHYVYAAYLLPIAVPATPERFYLSTPLSHVAGTVALYASVKRGNCCIVVDGFSPRRFWEDVRGFGAHATFIISSMATLLSKQEPQPDDADNPLRYAYMAPLLPGLKAFEQRFGVAIYSAFGMTEVPSAIRTSFSPDDLASCGHAVDPDNYELRIVDESDWEVPTGEVGELVVRHRFPWVLNSGYRDMPEATLDAWRNGWFHTGDFFRREADGSYYLVDRKKDSIRRRGENISSAEIEHVLIQHPGVLEAAVIPVPAPDGPDEEVKAVLIAGPAGLDLTELVEFLVPRLPHYMVPRYFEVVDDLPRTPSLRVEKFRLRSAGITDTTWDREAAGVRVGRERLG